VKLLAMLQANFSRRSQDGCAPATDRQFFSTSSSDGFGCMPRLIKGFHPLLPFTSIDPTIRVGEGKEHRSTRLNLFGHCTPTL
jgi:hypothetical protein